MDPTTTLTRDQVRRIDRDAIERYAIPSLILMENAGRGAAEEIHRSLGPPGGAIIVCGGGNNGGDGCVIARHLFNLGWRVRLLMTADPLRLAPDTMTNYRIVCRLPVDSLATDDLPHQQTFLKGGDGQDILVDALLGIGFSGEVRASTAGLIQTMNGTPRRALVAIDVPSGLDGDSGTPGRSVIRADLTLTFVAPKRGFQEPSAGRFTGRMVVIPIGIPPPLLKSILKVDE